MVDGVFNLIQTGAGERDVRLSLFQFEPFDLNGVLLPNGS
jgi:hypothetical protein